MVDALGPHEIATMENSELNGLKKQLAERDASHKLDGYSYYLYVISEVMSNNECMCSSQLRHHFKEASKRGASQENAVAVVISDSITVEFLARAS